MMKLTERMETIDKAMRMCEAELLEKYDDETVALAKAGISSMIQTIGINIQIHKDQNLDLGKVICVALTLLRTLDNATDHVADKEHEKN